MTPEQREQARKLCEEATPGPWIQDEDNPRCVGTPKPWYPPQVYGVVTVLEGGKDYTRAHNEEALADAAFIAAARTLLPAALSALDVVEAECERLRASRRALYVEGAQSGAEEAAELAGRHCRDAGERAFAHRHRIAEHAGRFFDKHEHDPDWKAAALAPLTPEEAEVARAFGIAEVSDG